MFDPFGNALEWLKVWTRGLGSCCYCCWASNVVVWIGITLVKTIGNAATLFFCIFIKNFRYQVPNKGGTEPYKGYFGDGLSLT